MKQIKKYDIWLIDLEPVIWSEQAWIRPCLVIQNDRFFKFQNTNIVLPITSQDKNHWEFWVLVKDYKKVWLSYQSIIITFQIRSADKSRFIKKIWEINDLELRLKIKNSLDLTLDLKDDFLN